MAGRGGPRRVGALRLRGNSSQGGARGFRTNEISLTAVITLACVVPRQSWGNVEPNGDGIREPAQSDVMIRGLNLPTCAPVRLFLPLQSGRRVVSHHVSTLRREREGARPSSP